MYHIIYIISVFVYNITHCKKNCITNIEVTSKKVYDKYRSNGLPTILKRSYPHGNDFEMTQPPVRFGIVKKGFAFSVGMGGGGVAYA